MTARRRLATILERPSPDDTIARSFNLAMLALISANVVAMIVETVPEARAEAGSFFQWFEVVSVAIFAVEYLLRVWACTELARFHGPIRGRLRFVFTPIAVVDLVAIAPFFVPWLGLDLRSAKALRVFRVFRVIKAGRYSRRLQLFGAVFRDKRAELLAALLVTLTLLTIASSLMYFIEHQAQPDAFASIPATMWWGVATLTTVGYGDIYPVTVAGKLLGSAIAILGIGLFALPTGILSAGLVEKLQASRAARQVCPTCGHCSAERGRRAASTSDLHDGD